MALMPRLDPVLLSPGTAGPRLPLVVLVFNLMERSPPSSVSPFAMRRKISSIRERTHTLVVDVSFTVLDRFLLIPVFDCPRLLDLL